MSSLKIRVFKGDDKEPETTVKMPVKVLRVASKLVPKKAAAALEEKGIDLNQIVELAQEPGLHGTLVEIEEHKKNEKIVISIE